MSSRPGATPMLLLLVALLSGTLACTSTPAASSASSASITITDAWVRPAAVGAQTAAYLTIKNTGSAPEALVGVTAADASMAGLHQTSTDASGMTGMSPVDEIAIPAGGSVALAPGGFHVMLMGLKRELATGGTVTLRLTFRGAGTVTVEAAVRPS